jgi:large subunit ribosomal protein L15
VVSLARLARFGSGAVVDEETLRHERIVKGRGPIKILSDGDVAVALTIKVAAVSAKAREKILAAGGTVEGAGS